MGKVNSIAIILARGGSKRIPRKNIVEFLGQPIIHYSIKAARESALFDEIMVSTDDDEIRDIAVQNGANVPFLRSAKNASDQATTVDALIEVIEEYDRRDIQFKYGCCIYSAAPLLKPQKLIEAKNLLIDKEYDAVFPVQAFSTPIQRALRLQDSKIDMLDFNQRMIRTQDLETRYHDTGTFYWFNTEVLIKKQQLLTDNAGAIVLSALEAQDIDDPIDLELAKLKYKLQIENWE